MQRSINFIGACQQTIRAAMLTMFGTNCERIVVLTPIVFSIFRSAHIRGCSKNAAYEPWINDARKEFKWSPMARAGGDMGWGFRLPKLEGSCVRTTIAVIADRYGSDPKAPNASGTTVLLSNGGHLITYDSDDVLIESRVGDPVGMCLASIPVDCPSGDERGREYTVTNLRTHGHTTLGDSQHVCGGA